MSKKVFFRARGKIKMHLPPDNDSLANQARRLTAYLGNCLSKLSISAKIKLGYVLTLGIALSGTIIGISIGEIYQNYSHNLIKDALEENELFYELITDLLEAKNLEQELFFLLDKPEKFKQRYALFFKEVKDLDETWKQITSSYANTKVKETSEESEVFAKISKEYNGLVKDYFQESQRIYKQLEKSNLTPSEIANIRQQILTLNSSDSSIKVISIIEIINDAINIINREIKEAQRSLVLFSRIRLAIIATSILVSIVFVLIITFYLIKSISFPLQTLTKITEKVSRESNFYLQIPITTSDEIGILSKTFNQMISQIRELLIEQHMARENLEIYNHLLETKVQQRTEELQEKNIYLQQTMLALKNTQNQIIQNEKMSSLGQLVAGVAHEINNPLSFIYGNLTHFSEYTYDLLNLIKLYQEVYKDPENIIQEQIQEIDLEYIKKDLPKLISSITIGTKRITEIVKSLRNFSRLDEAEYKEANIHEGIDGTLMILHHRLKANGEQQEIQVIKEYTPLPLVTCYPGQLNQVFMNILSNSIDAIEEYNQKSPKEESHIAPGKIRIYTQQIDNKWIRIGIKDNAKGIPEKIVSQLFDPFFTTKPVGKGTGLGLSISYQIIVEKHGGKLLCNSKPGEGAEFVIEIPISN